MPKGCVYFVSQGKSSAGTLLPSINHVCLRQISSSGVFVCWGKIKIHGFGRWLSTRGLFAFF